MYVPDQVHPTLNALEAHTAAYADTAEYPETPRKDVVDAFKAQCTKHYHPAQPAPFMLDPVNFEMHEELSASCRTMPNSANLDACLLRMMGKFVDWIEAPALPSPCLYM